MEQHICAICGQTYDTGSILMDTHLKNRFDRNTVTGTGLCEEHQKLADDGYIALIEINNDSACIKVSLEDANRTGRVAHIKSEAFSRMFNTPLDKSSLPMAFIEPKVFEELEELAFMYREEKV